MTRRSAAFVAIVLLLGVAIAAPAAARADATIVSSSVENGYPKTLTFKLSAQSAQTITEVALRYSLSAAGGSAVSKPEDFTPGPTISAEVVVQTNSGTGYIPVGTEFVYHWEISTADGATTSGPESRFFYLPPDQDWQTARSDLVVVYFHGNQQTAADAFVKAVAETYDKIGTSLLNTSLKALPIKAIYFGSTAEMQDATVAGSTKFDQAVTTCGQRPANTSDIIFLNPARCGSSDSTDTLRHEFTHLLTKAAGESGLGKLPAWLDEGTAVNGQTAPGNYANAFQSAMRGDRLIPFNQMGTPPGDANQIDLFYGQAYTMVKYLIDKGGAGKFADYFATIKKGVRFDQALQQVYGFDIPGFEKEFVANGGSTKPSKPSPTAQPKQTQPTATAVSGTAASTSTDSGSGSLSRSTLAMLGVAVIFLLVAIFFFLLNLQVAAKRRAAEAASPPPPDDWQRPQL